MDRTACGRAARLSPCRTQDLSCCEMTVRARSRIPQILAATYQSETVLLPATSCARPILRLPTSQSTDPPIHELERSALMPEILTHSECVAYVEQHGDARTMTALNKYRDDLRSDSAIEFRWGSVTCPRNRCRCIRGAFHRMSDDGLKQGRCSTHFDAEFRFLA